MRCPARALADPGGRRGLSLLELLLVLAILAVVLGGGLGALAALDPGPKSSAGALASLLEAASDAAAARADGARVRLANPGPAEPGRPRARLETFVVVGTWHFEGDLAGAFGLHGEGRETRFVDDGWIGRALAFSGAPASAAAFDLRSAGFEPDAGFALELALWPPASGQGGRVLELGGVVLLELGGAGDLRGSFVPASEGGGGSSAEASGRTASGRARAGLVQVHSPPAVVTPGRWSRVGLRYDGERLALLVEGLEVAGLEVRARVAPAGSTLVLGDPERGFAGALDALVVRVLAAGDALELPTGLRFGPDTPPAVVFDGDGRLDAARHPAAGGSGLTLTLVSERGPTRTLVVHPRGTVTRP